MLLLMSVLAFAEPSTMYKPEDSTPPNAWMKSFNDHPWNETCPAIADDYYQAFHAYVTQSPKGVLRKKVEVTTHAHIGIMARRSPSEGDMCINDAFTEWFEAHPLDIKTSTEEPFELVWSMQVLKE